nr:hypothetical protein [Tanacetum cinerariifolium]
MEIKLAECSLKITKNLISEMLGIRNEGIDIMAKVGNKNEKMVSSWMMKYGNRKDITPGDIKLRIRKSNSADMYFKLNFIVLFTSMAYVDGSKCSSFNVVRKRPPTLVWTSELLRERDDEEFNSGGFGFCEIEGLFVEQEDHMPDNIEGFVWKLNKHVNSIIKEKSRFEKTLDAAEYIFLGKLAGFFERYVGALKYQGCRKEGSGKANKLDANRAADAQADGQNNEGASFVSVQAMIGEGAISLGDEHADIGMDQEANELVDKLSNEKRFGSPTLYNMEPETQEVVLRRVDVVDAEIERRKWFDMSDIPSFSLGLTQEYAHLDQDVVTPVETTQEPNLASEISNPVPLRVFPPWTAVGRLRRDTDKRSITIFEVRKSPFIGRVVDVDGS